VENTLNRITVMDRGQSNHLRLPKQPVHPKFNEESTSGHRGRACPE
jgi:hypothetical protein